MTNKQIKKFYVNREAECLTDDQVEQLHKWCIEAGANKYESVDAWDGHRYLGVDEYNDTFSTDAPYVYYKSIPFSEVRSHLGLPDIPTEPLTEELSLVGLSPSESVNTSKGAEPDALYKYKGIPVIVHYVGEKRSLVSSEFEEEFSIWTKDLEKGTIEKDIIPKEEIIMTNVKRVNAGFKSVGEMAQAMFDGAVLYWDERVFFYQKDEIYPHGGFKCYFLSSKQCIWDICQWHHFAEMEIEKEVMWWEDIDEDNPPLCKVWGGGHGNKEDNVTKYVCFYSVGCRPFGAIDHFYYSDAIPTGLFKKDIDALGE